MDADPLIVEREGALVILRLNNPGRLNALSGAMRARLEQEVPAIAYDPSVRAIMITGVGRGFCAGGDVSGMGGARAANVGLPLQTAHLWVKALRASEALVVTAVNGPAAGAGFGVALLGDVVLASTAAFFKAGFTDLGVAADYGLAWNLPRAVGAARAGEILFSDRRVSAEEAARIGLIGRLIEAERFEMEALEYARKMARASRGASLSKRLLRRSGMEGFEAFLDLEARTQNEAFQSQDFREGVAAFREKRAAVFTGT